MEARQGTLPLIGRRTHLISENAMVRFHGVPPNKKRSIGNDGGVAVDCKSTPNWVNNIVRINNTPPVKIYNIVWCFEVVYNLR